MVLKDKYLNVYIRPEASQRAQCETKHNYLFLCFSVFHLMIKGISRGLQMYWYCIAGPDCIKHSQYIFTMVFNEIASWSFYERTFDRCYSIWIERDAEIRLKLTQANIHGVQQAIFTAL